MLQNPRKTLGFKKNMVYKIPPWGGGKPYPASGLIVLAFPDVWCWCQLCGSGFVVDTMCTLHNSSNSF